MNNAQKSSVFLFALHDVINLVDTLCCNTLIAADTYDLHKDEFAPPLDPCDVGKLLLKQTPAVINT